MEQNKTMEEKLSELQAKKGSNLKLWWNGLKWGLMGFLGILASAGSFNFAHEGHGEFWFFGAANLGIVLYFCVKGFRAYTKEIDAINKEIADTIRKGNRK